MERKQRLQIDLRETLSQERREWTIQRVAWAVLYALIVGVMLGLIGDGPFSEARSRAGPLAIEYSRFMRQGAPDRLLVVLRASPPVARVAFDAAYLERVGIEKIVPEPSKTLAEDGSLVFVFDVGSPGELRVEFQLNPNRWGRLQGWVTSSGPARLRLSQFVYP
ncbi:MAG TPA: hypothetical protein VFP68_13465 [Burkholderiaceae bacterium]|nr:hypothetical protein [Burkholderiaceae bacterium]